MSEYVESLNIHSNFIYTYAGNVFNYIKELCMHDNQIQAHWIYAAAIMDSDGCFMISRHKVKDRAEYLAMVKIFMIQDGSINYIHKMTGLGSITISGARKSRPNSKPLFQWRITKRADLIVFIQGIMPYLQNKKERAQHLLKYVNTIGCRPKNLRKTRLSDEELNYREESYRKMRELNGNNAGATTKPHGRESVCDSLI